MNFLVIEDDEIDAQLVNRSLAKAFPGCTPCVAGCLEDAVEMARSETFDAVLVDLTLPDSSGLSTVTRLVDVFPELPLIVLTGVDCHDVSLRAIEIGAQDFLVKGKIDPLLLERSIRYAIQRHQLREKNKQLLETLRKGEELLQAKNRKLERVCKTAQEFVDNVSHEFRTPLTVIMEYASLIADGVAGTVNSEQEQLLGVIDDRASDLNNMVDDMLDVSKLESGLLGASRSQCTVSEIVEHVLPAIRRKALVRNVTLDVVIDENLPDVYCDSAKVGRVIVNLAINAIKFAGNPGYVCLEAQKKNEYDVEITVSDNGIGIPSDRQKEIFKRFSQVKAALTESTKGFGLGLNIAHELVELNLGKMAVDSTEGKGSAFSFTIPINRPREIIERYLSQPASHPDAPSSLSVIRLELEGEWSESIIGDVYHFLIHVLRQHDLMFPIDSQSWLLLVSVPTVELDDFLGRLRKQRELINRNRPRGPLPEMTVHVQGTWQDRSCDDEILAVVDENLRPEACIV